MLRGSAYALGAAATLTSPLAFLQTKALAHGKRGNDYYSYRRHLSGTRGYSPYGPLSPAKDRATGLDLIMLPPGFSYTTFSWKGDHLSDGNIAGPGHDGMAVIAASSRSHYYDHYSYDRYGSRKKRRRGRSSQTYTLIRNHEVFDVGGGPPIAPNYNYDSMGGGGTSVLTWRDGYLKDHHVSISGTIANCAGGPTPWGTWLTCEEDIEDGEVPHGYVFESTVQRVTNATPLTAMGRFTHEAIAFDHKRGTVYLTEDDSSSIDGDPGPRTRGNSGFYKFVPNRRFGGTGSLERGGRLYILQARNWRTGEPVDDLRDPECFSSYRAHWIEITEPNAPPVASVSGPYTEGRSKGATRFQRLEGAWWDPVRHAITFVDTEGGPIGAEDGRTDRAEGALWRYYPRWNRLTNIFVSQGNLAPEAYGADNPDNVTVSPNGGILMCEDGGRNDGDGLSLLGLHPNGQTYEFARNIINIADTDAGALAAEGHDPSVIGTGDFSGQEWAGATFTPDGKTLFVNIQTPGITFAITGPFGKGPL